MIRSLWISKTGLDAQQTQLDVISNNLANVSTNGFKRSRAVFEDLLYQTLSQPGAQSSQQTQLPSGFQLGTGVRPVATEKIFTQGNLQQTNNPLDVAIQGNGFFQVLQPDGTIAYTRDGSFQLDNQGAPGRDAATGEFRQPDRPAECRTKSVPRNCLFRHAQLQHARNQWPGDAQTGFRRDLKRQCGRGNGQHDPDPARLRDQFESRYGVRPDAAKTI